tara:strand:+ start:982 stop:1095 length:114 start_codon:yes stop_codon:yes gene_type:complete
MVGKIYYKLTILYYKIKYKFSKKRAPVNQVFIYEEDD